MFAAAAAAGNLWQPEDGNKDDIKMNENEDVYVFLHSSSKQGKDLRWRALYAVCVDKHIPQHLHQIWDRHINPVTDVVPMLKQLYWFACTN